MPQTTTISDCRPWKATINPAPPQSPDTKLLSVAAISTSDVWAVGYTIQSANNDAPTLTLIEHWNGQSWQIIPSPSPQLSGDNALFSVAAVSTNDVWAVGFSSPLPGPNGFGGGSGQTLIEHWDGTSWNVITSPNPLGSVNSLLIAVAIVGANDVWAAGAFRNTTDPNGPFSTLIEHWDGTSWQIVQSPNPESTSWLGSLAVVSARDIWAVGFSSPTPLGGPRHTLTEHWNGTAWQVVPSPNTTLAVNQLIGVAAVSTHDVWAVGHSFAGSPNPPLTLTLHWNGRQWRIVASPNPGWGGNSLVAVATISAHNVWAVGASTNNLFNTLQRQTLVEHWNGKAWQVVPSQSPGVFANVLLGIVRVPGTQTLWAVGQEADASVIVQPISEFSC